MAVAAPRTSTNGRPIPDGTRGGGTLAGKPGRHRQVPLVVVGVLLVVGCALGFADASLNLASHEDVLAVSQPLAAGQVLAPGDLRAVRVSTGAGLARRATASLTDAERRALLRALTKIVDEFADGAPARERATDQP